MNDYGLGFPSSFRVLNDEVAGIARHHHGLELSVAADLDHFCDVNEMVLNPLPAVETKRPCGLDDGLKIPVLGVSKDLGKVPTGSELVARRIGAADSLKGGDFPAHRCELLECGCSLSPTARMMSASMTQSLITSGPSDEGVSRVASSGLAAIFHVRPNTCSASLSNKLPG